MSVNHVWAKLQLAKISWWIHKSWISIWVFSPIIKTFSCFIVINKRCWWLFNLQQRVLRDSPIFITVKTFLRIWNSPCDSIKKNMSFIEIWTVLKRSKIYWRLQKSWVDIRLCSPVMNCFPRSCWCCWRCWCFWWCYFFWFFWIRWKLN